MLTEKSALIAVLTGAIAPILPPYTISLGPLYHKILSPPLLKYKLGLAKMKQAIKKTQKLLICEMSSNTANKMRGAQTLWNINHFIGGYNLFRTRGTYLLNKGKKTPFRKIVILENYYFAKWVLVRSNEKKSPDCSKHLSFYWWTQFVSDEKDIFAK